MKKKVSPATSGDYSAFKSRYGKSPIDMGVGMHRDEEGVFVHTHRARSSSYKSADKIPPSVIKRIERTG